MASLIGSDQDAAATCLVCFGNGTKLKTVGPCKHFCCIECLEKHLSSQPTGGEVFPCPSCQKECRLPSSGVAGLDDWSRVSDETAEDVAASGADGGAATNVADSSAGKRPCQVCQCRDAPAPDAEFCCEQCRGLLLCKTCADQHKLLPATGHHVVTRFSESGTGFTECGRHQMPLEMFCTACECPACSLCVILDHGDHDIVEIVGAISKASDDLEEVLRTGTTKITELEQLRDETNAARDVILNWRGRMIQEVEATTEKAINRLLEQKEKLKTDIKSGCDVSEMTDMLQKIPEVVELIQKDVEKGQAILKRKKLDSGFLSELKEKRKELAVALESDDLERDLHWRKLREPLPLFKESETLKDIDLGQIVQFNYDTRNIGTTLKTNLHYNNESAQIHSVVANVDRTDHACALAVSFGNDPLASRCDLLEHQDKTGRSKQTLIENKIVGMAATIDGGIAILYLVGKEGKKESENVDGVSALTVFKPKHGDKTGTLVCNNLEKAVAFSANIRGQFVVLSNKTGGIQQISVLNKSGGVIDASETHSRGFRRVACGGRYNYILGTGCVDVFGTEKGKIVFVQSVKVHKEADDITATPSDDVFVSVSKPSEVKVVKVFHLGNYLKRHPRLLLKKDERGSGESRLDISDTWIIVSQGCIFYLYQLHNGD